MITQFESNGKILMAALDHRGSFAKTAGTEDCNTLIQIKRHIIEGVYDQCSGLLLDQDFGLPAYQQYCKDHHIDHPKPWITCIEETGYENQDEEKITSLQYNVSSLKQIGASGIKLLLFFNPDGRSVQKQIHTAKSVLADCKKESLPFFLEIVTYPIPSHAYEKSDVIYRSLTCLINENVIPDVWKLEYPGDQFPCQQITNLVGSIPWILLTRGVSFNEFSHQLEIATRSGCNGFLAGRAIWQEFLQMKTEKEKRSFFTETIPQRFQKICTIATR